MCMISAVLFYASSLILIKIINIVEPGISPFTMLSIRSVMNLVLLTPVASMQKGKSIKDVLWSPFKVLPTLTFMISFFGTIYDIVICVVCAGNLPIVNVSIFINMAPLFTVILAVWVLKERLTLFNLI